MAFCPQKIDQIGRRNVVLFQSRIWLSRILIGVRPFHLYAIMRIDETGRHRGINQWVLIKPLVHMDSWEKLNHL